jgi:hypothetical protein
MVWMSASIQGGRGYGAHIDRTTHMNSMVLAVTFISGTAFEVACHRLEARAGARREDGGNSLGELVKALTALASAVTEARAVKVRDPRKHIWESWDDG